MYDVGHPDAADGELLLRDDADRVAFIAEVDLRAVVDLHDGVACRVYERELVLGRKLEARVAVQRHTRVSSGSPRSRFGGHVTDGLTRRLHWSGCRL